MTKSYHKTEMKYNEETNDTTLFLLTFLAPTKSIQELNHEMILHFLHSNRI